ncbi:MAG: UDP-N-acetylglucosamine 2-epimerase [Geobacteraceae bacterium GWB2_52_12]|nr:MAG: UDP-N-acetylglucosamine 2-epimerase [Geobacteraceae bacterium GWB2_52_12]
MKHVLFIFGTRPEAIKMAPLVLRFKAEASLKTTVCVTGQHRDMLDQVLKPFGIRPDIDLDVMRQDQDLFDVTLNILHGLKPILQKLVPDIVFVHGDTTTTFTASLAAFYCKIRVAHIEAGLRTHNFFSPWPEELNRQLTARLASYHFAPTEGARQNLLKEGIRDDQIMVTGNTVIDALHYIQDKIEQNPALKARLARLLRDRGYPFPDLKDPRRIVLVTGHRRENFGEGFRNICSALKQIAIEYQDVDVVYPVHLNPNVRKIVLSMLSNIPNIYLIEPLEYEPFIFLMNASSIVVTDSGGIQEEAPSLGKPVLVMRNQTERPEAVSAGTVRLVGTDPGLIKTVISRLLTDSAYYASMAQAVNPYGDGKAANRIFELLQEFIGGERHA